MRRRLSYGATDVAAMFRERTGLPARAVKSFRGVASGSAINVWGVRTDDEWYFVVVGQAVEVFPGGQAGRRWSSAQPAADAYRQYLAKHAEESALV